MKAYLLTAFDGPGALHLSERPVPHPGPCEVGLRVEAIGINYPDLLATRGEYQHLPELPYVPGCEIAGTVIEAGPGSEWSVGDDVAAFVWDGGFAEVAVVPDSSLMRRPRGMSAVDGAALVVNYQTVHFGLVRRGQLRSGDRVMVLGAAGGIGTAAVQVAQAVGARVIAGVANEEQASLVRDLGVDEAIVLTESFAPKVLELTDGRGVDVILDPIGGPYFQDAIRALAPEGRILVLGFAAGGIPSVKVNRLLLRNISAVGVAWGAFLTVDPKLMRTTGEELAEMYLRGQLRPKIGLLDDFAGLPAALTLLGDGKISGKAVVQV